MSSESVTDYNVEETLYVLQTLRVSVKRTFLISADTLTTK